MIRQLRVLSPIRKTLMAPWRTVNRVALDNNSLQALPLPWSALLLQAEHEDEGRWIKRGEEERSVGAAASFSLLKVSSAAINLGLDCVEQKIITQSYNFMAVGVPHK